MRKSKKSMSTAQHVALEGADACAMTFQVEAWVIRSAAGLRLQCSDA